jgi:hypothetical protein
VSGNLEVRVTCGSPIQNDPIPMSQSFCGTSNAKNPLETYSFLNVVLLATQNVETADIDSTHETKADYSLHSKDVFC